jgi:hypothetical protein
VIIGNRSGIPIVCGGSENVSNKKYNEKEKMNEIIIKKAIFFIFNNNSFSITYINTKNIQ